jgi:hypothetical protein
MERACALRVSALLDRRHELHPKQLAGSWFCQHFLPNEC